MLQEHARVAPVYRGEIQCKSTRQTLGSFLVRHDEQWRMFH
ncbi:MAG: hypothetical protein QOI11_3053 [Candidatus Eremiobacteraeota bacterium]|jgi:hypothetical protein|nr:hypothetical protein [Candidatus Eremiobacteraeota bacterium]